MFSKGERLPRADFSSALRSGKRVSSANFTLIFPKDSRGYAVVIPKKVIRQAAKRNRVKRQVLEAFRSVPLPPALIVFPRFGANSVDYKDIVAELSTLLSKNTQ